MHSLEQPERKLRVAVLMGGTSSERPISLSTGKMILSALDQDRYTVVAIDTKDLLSVPDAGGEALPAAGLSESRMTADVTEDTEDSCSSLSSAIQPSREKSVLSVPSASSMLSVIQKPDVVFIALHGKGGEDGTIQGMLELLGLTYTGSGVMASALAMDKAMTKRLFRSAGIPVLEDLLVRRGQALDPAALTAGVCQLLGGFPVFVKPNAEGSTFGCTLVANSAELPGAIETALKYDRLTIIERYARGMEITVGVLGNTGDPEGVEALPVIEIVPKATYYDYESKYAEGGSEHIIPARLSEALLRRAQETAVRCHEMLGCRGMSRTDMIVAGQELYVLEVNTIPGMTPTSLLPQAAAQAGIPFAKLLDRLIESALRRE